MSTYPYPASLVYEKLDLNEVTFRSWRNRLGLHTDGRGEYRWSDALRIVALRELMGLGLTPEHAVSIINHHREHFASLGEHRDSFLLTWERMTNWSSPFILTGDRLNRAHDRYLPSFGDLLKEMADRGLPPTAILVDLGRVAQRTRILLGLPPKEAADV
jgi:hypothetical protein